MKKNFLIGLLFAMVNCHCAALPAPYNTLKETLPFRYEGWYEDTSLMEKLLRERNAKIVIELGSWMGKSTLHIARTLSKGGIVYAVDHWFAPPHDLIPIWYEKFNTTSLYQQFLSNVIHAKLTDKIIPVRMSTLEGARFLQEQGIQADLVYVDASHDEESVYADLEAYFPLVKGHGVLCGNSWTWGIGWGWSMDELPVKTAVTRFAEEKNLKVTLYHDAFWILHEN